MLKLFFGFVKLVVFTVVILIAGSLIRWNGRTISDQIQSHLSHAESSETVDRMKSWAGGLVEDMKKGSQKKAAREVRGVTTQPARGENEKIPNTERQKLRALIQELNSSYSKN